LSVILTTLVDQVLSIFSQHQATPTTGRSDLLPSLSSPISQPCQSCAYCIASLLLVICYLYDYVVYAVLFQHHYYVGLVYSKHQLESKTWLVTLGVVVVVMVGE
jgi:hypothetical protein